MTMGQHDLDNVDGCKSFVPAPPGDRDFSQQFRGYCRRDPSRFSEEVLASGTWKVTDNIQTFEQRPPRSKGIRGGLSVGNPKEGGRAYGGIGHLSLSSRIHQKIVWHGVSLAPPACMCMLSSQGEQNRRSATPEYEWQFLEIRLDDRPLGNYHIVNNFARCYSTSNFRIGDHTGTGAATHSRPCSVSNILEAISPAREERRRGSLS